MQASECCIFRVMVAAFVGAIAGIVILWDHGVLMALGLSPIFASTAAACAVAAFWSASLLVPCQPTGEAVRSPPTRTGPTSR